MLNPDPKRPGFGPDHHELIALTAPRAFLLIGGSQSEDRGGDCDDLQSRGYFNLVALAIEDSIDRIGNISADLAHPQAIGGGPMPAIPTV